MKIQIAYRRNRISQMNWTIKRGHNEKRRQSKNGQTRTTVYLYWFVGPR